MYIRMYAAASTLFATTARRETPNGTISGVTYCPPPPVPKVTPKIVPFSKNNLTMKSNYTNKVETPMWIFTFIGWSFMGMSLP